VSGIPPVTGPEIGDNESQFSKVNRKEEEEPDFSGTICPPNTLTSSRTAEREEPVHFGDAQTITELDEGTTAAESIVAPMAEKLHW